MGAVVGSSGVSVSLLWISARRDSAAASGISRAGASARAGLLVLLPGIQNLLPLRETVSWRLAQGCSCSGSVTIREEEGWLDEDVFVAPHIIARTAAGRRGLCDCPDGTEFKSDGSTARG